MKNCLVLGLLLASIGVFAQEHLDLQDQLLAEVNEYRKKNNRKPVVYNPKYQNECDEWSMFIVRNYRHNRGSQFDGEAISVKADTDYIISSFMESPGHRDILLEKKATSICLSVYSMPADTIKMKNSVVVMFPSYYTVIRTYKN